ncbi:marR family protein, partial [Vibrio parahaemolyticus V-223/04]
KERLYCQRAQ